MLLAKNNNLNMSLKLFIRKTFSFGRSFFLQKNFSFENNYLILLKNK